MKHEIDEETLNSNIEYCINEYVRLVRDREILREKWFHGLSISAIAEKHELTDTTIKEVLYGIGDKILLRASKMK